MIDDGYTTYTNVHSVNNPLSDNVDVYGAARITLIEQTISSNTYLKTLNATNGSYGFFTSSFNKNTKTYSVAVPNSVSKLNVTATAEDSKTTISGTGLKELNLGNNTIKVTTTAEDGTTDFYIINVYRQSDNSYLDDIKVDENSIENFNSTTLEYTLTFDSSKSSVSIEPIKGQSGQTLYYSNPLNLNYGNNSTEIMVTSESGTTTIYNLNIIRQNPTLLKFLSVDNFEIEPVFSSNNFEYYLDVYDNTESINVNAELMDGLIGTITGTGLVNLTENEITHNVTVTGENNDSNTYVIHINKAINSDNTLNSIEIGNNNLVEYSVVIENDETNYVLNVPYQYEEFNYIQPTSNNNEQTYKYKLNDNYVEDNQFSLINENNVLEVEVYDGLNKLSNTYTININRVKSNIASLDSLEVNKGNLEEVFNSNSFNYTWNIPKDTTILTSDDITYTLSDLKSSASVQDVTYTQDGDKFNIIVTAEDGVTTNTYELTLNHILSSEARLKSLDVDDFDLVPIFDKDVNEYTLNVYDNTNTIDFTGETLDNDATIITNLQNVNTNNTPLNITVQAEEGTTNIYKININKSISSDNTIKKIQIGNDSKVDKEINIIDNVFNYPIDVTYQYTNFNYINVISNNNQQTYKYYMNDVLIEDIAYLNEGDNILKVEVYDGLNKLSNTYNVIITRKKSNDALLKSLSVKYGDITPTFKSNTTNYTWTLPKGTTRILNSDIETETNSEYATVSIPAITSYTQDGDTLTITVTAEDGVTTKDYVLTLNHELSNEARLKNLSVEVGKLRTKFNKDTYTYDVDTYTSSTQVNIIAQPIDDDATVTGTGILQLENTNTTHTITVVSEDQTETKIYTINIHKTIDETDNTITSLKIGNDNQTDYTVLFENGVNKYTLEVAEDYKLFNYMDVELNNTLLTPTYYMNGETVTTEAKVLEGANVFKIVLKDQNNEDVNTYYITIIRTRTTGGSSSGGGSSMSNGDYEAFGTCSIDNTFVAPNDGYYQLEVWGASGGFKDVYRIDISSVGGYATGVVKLNSGDKLYPVPGGMGGYSHASQDPPANPNGGCNGGGNALGANPDASSFAYSDSGGGGASHIALRQGYLRDLENYKDDVLIVAGGGSGNYGRPYAGGNDITVRNIQGTGSGGGFRGLGRYNGATSLEPDQDSGYAFGQGQDAQYKSHGIRQFAAGGGGWYGGYAGSTNDWNATGGSGYIGNSKLLSYSSVEKHMAILINSENTNSSKYISSDSNTKTITLNSQDSNFVNHYFNGVYTTNLVPSQITEEHLKSDKIVLGSGWAKITMLAKDQNLNLKTLIVQDNVLNPSFNSTTYAYSLTVDTPTINIAAELEDESNTVTGIGVVNVQTGTNTYNIVVTSPDGDTQIYALTITRTASSNADLSNIIVDGTPVSEFDKDTLSYNLESDKSSIEIVPVKGHDGQTLTYTSPVTVNPGNNSYNIVVTAEDNTTTKTYTVNVYKESLVGLGSLEVEGFTLSPEFDTDTHEYIVKTYKNTSKVNIIAELLDSNVSTLTGDGEVTITSDNMTHNIIVTGIDGTIVTYEINIKREVEYNDELKNITIKNESVTCKNNMCTLNPAFTGARIGYTFDVPYSYDSFDLLIEKNEDDQSYKTILNGVETDTYSLNEGENTLKVELYDGLNKLVRTYTVIINRTKSGDATLKSLTSDKGILTPTFDKDTTSYELKVYDNETSVTLSGETNDENATVLSGLGEVTLTNNTTNHEIEVEAEDGTILTYTVVIKKSISSDVAISDIQVISNKGELTKSPIFISSTKDYSVDIPFRDSISEINVISSNNKLTKKVKLNGNYVDNYALNLNTNIFTIEIYDELNKKVDEYKITVNRIKSNVATLDELTVNIGSIKETFESDTYNYTWIIPKNVSEVIVDNINYKLTDRLSTVNTSSTVPYSENATFDIVVTAEDGTTTNTYSLLLEYEKSNDATLKSLEVEGFKLDKTFNGSTTSYTVNVYTNTTEVKVNAETNDEFASILSGIGTISLTSDEQVNNIIVSAEDGTTNTYELTIKRVGSPDRSISNIRIYNNSATCETNECVYDKEFNQGVTEYSMSVPYDFSSFNVEVVSENNEITNNVIVNGIDTDSYNLNVGNNIVLVEVYDGINNLIDTYQFNIERKESDNNYLSRLTISGYELNPTFVKTTEEYTIELDENTSSIALSNFYVKTEDSRATYTITGYNNLSNDRNNIVIYVSAPNGDIREYVIHANKGTPTNLTSLTVSKIDGELFEMVPEFNTNTLSYTLTVPNDIEAVYVDAVAEYNDEVTITGTGLHELNVGKNTINVIVMNETGHISTYILNITREIDTDVDLISLSVDEAFEQIDFYRDITSYNLEVGDTVTSMTINAVPSNPKAIIEITGNKIVATKGFYNSVVDRGYANKVKVIVYNSNKTIKKEYYLNVAREANDNTNLNGVEMKDNLNRTINHNCPAFNEQYRDVCYISVYDDSQYIYSLATPEVPTSVIKNQVSNAITEEQKRTVKSSILKDSKIVVQAESGRSYSYDLFYYMNKQDNFEMEKILVNYAVGNNIRLESLNFSYDNDKELYVLNVPSNIDYVELVYSILYSPRVSFIFNGEIVKDLGYFSGKNEYENALKQKYNLDGVIFFNNLHLKSGENFGKITLTKFGMSKEIVFVINKEYDSNNYIKSLTTNGMMDKVFDKETLEYNVDVRKNVDMLDLGIELESSAASYEIIGNNDFTMDNNPNEVIIRVTAENGDVRDYKLNVNVRPDSFFSFGPENISVSEGTLTPDFDIYTNNYVVSVPYDIISLDVEVTKRNSAQEVTISGTSGTSKTIDLSLGSNIVPIVVSSGDNSVTYNITINRGLNTDATLKSLKINDSELIDIYNLGSEATISINSDAVSLDLEAIPNDENATYYIRGNDVLVGGRNVVEVVVTAQDGVTTKTYNINVNKDYSANNFLKSLEVEEFEISPSFNKNTDKYTLTVPNETSYVNILAEAEDPRSTVTGDGYVDLDVGSNTITITVVSENGDVNTYELTITRSISSNSLLESLFVSDGTLSPSFDSETFEYTLTVPENVDEVNFIGTPMSTTSMLSGNGYHEVSDGDAEIIVVSEDLSSRHTYTIHMMKDGFKSAYLKSLTITDGELIPKFSKTTTTYAVTVPFEVNNLNMTYVPEDPDATVVISGNENFVIGQNKVTISVTSSDEFSNMTYEIYVTKTKDASNYLSSLVVEGYEISPAFDKATSNYTLEVGNDVSEVNIIATKEDESSIVTGDGINALDYGENTIRVVVTSVDEVQRTYIITINRTLSDENLLLELTSDVGEFDKSFDPEEHNYKLTLPMKTKKFTLSGNISENATVNGLGEVNVNMNSFTQLIYVKSQSGVLNTYSVEVEKLLSDNTNLRSLVPSIGSIEFDNEINDYTINVNDSIKTISFEASPEDEDATVTGIKETFLDYGDNTIAIKVTAEDGTERNINITVNMSRELDSISLESDEITVIKGTDETINVIKDPVDANVILNFETLDPLIAVVNDLGVVTGIDEGTTTIKITVEEYEDIELELTVNVVSDKLKSEIYTVDNKVKEKENEEDEDTFDRIVIGAEAGTTIAEFKENMSNPAEFIKIYDKEGNLVSDEDIVRTGLIIKLENNSVVHDEAILIVRGDIDGDGIIDVTDESILAEHILEIEPITGIGFYAADIEEDDILDVSDDSTLSDYILMIIDSLN